MSVYGIDLGTTYSCIAKVKDDGTVEVIRNQADQKTTLASAVFYDDDGNYIVGDAAKETMIDAPDRLCQFFKRYIGRPELLQKARKEEPDLYIVDGEERDPVELSALVLKKIIAYAKEQGEDVNDAVITCPAYFDQSQRESTKKAGELAGINVLGIINEPTAAVMNYAKTLGESGIGENMNVLVYDLGGGTFDITLVRLSKQANGNLMVQALASVGDDVLGGKDWDQSLEDLVKRKLAEEVGRSVADISQDVTFAIRAQVEKMKQALTEKASVTFKFTDDNGNRRKIPVTREEFDEATSLHLNKTMPLVQSVLQNTTPAKPNAMSPEEVDIVLMVGGSTLMPQVKAALSELFDESKIILSDPHQAVAKGAAIVAKDIRDGIDIDALERLREMLTHSDVEITKDNRVIDTKTGEEVKDATETLTKMISETQPAESVSSKSGVSGIPINTSMVTEMIAKKSAEQQSRLELMDVSPTTFGVVVLSGFDAQGERIYKAVNLLMIGQQVPCDETYEDGATSNETQEHVTVPLVTSRSHEKKVPVTEMNGKFYADDPSIDLKTVAVLEVPVKRPHSARTQVIVHFKMNDLGEITLSAEIPETGDSNTLTVNFAEGYDEQKVEEMRNRTQGEFKDDYDL